ncbi:hypothetical protein B5S33_g2948 [[Candida] boidinii]|nr:hypothetical protein B5S33_g2948 [[Candida] boidinii]
MTKPAGKKQVTLSRFFSSSKSKSSPKIKKESTAQLDTPGSIKSDVIPTSKLETLSNEIVRNNIVENNDVIPDTSFENPIELSDDADDDDDENAGTTNSSIMDKSVQNDDSADLSTPNESLINLLDGNKLTVIPDNKKSEPETEPEILDKIDLGNNILADINDDSLENPKEDTSIPLQISQKLESFKNKRSLEDTTIPSPLKNKSPKKQKTKSTSTATSSNTTTKPKLTPLEQQFIQLKTANKDKILAIRVGYKYKFFGNDAKIASKLLNIMLIPGKMTIDDSLEEDKGFDKFAYCSIPDNRLHIHMKNLLNNGLKIGVVEQLETTAIKSNSENKNKLFQRDLTKVYSIGTYIDDLDYNSSANKRNYGEYIMAINETKSTDFDKNNTVDTNNNNNNNISNNKIDCKVSIAAINLFSGEVYYDDFFDDLTRNELDTRLYHLKPTEILILNSEKISKQTENCINYYKLNNFKKNPNSLRVLKLGKVDSFTNYLNLIKTYLNLNSQGLIKILKNFNPCLQFCCFELIIYLNDFKLSSIFENVKYQKFNELNKASFLIDSRTLKNLEILNNSTNGEIKGSLLWLLDHTSTKFGGRLFKSWLTNPLKNVKEIENRQNSIEFLIDNYNIEIFEKIHKFLISCNDLQLILVKVHFNRCKRKEIYLFLKKFKDLNEILNLTNFESLHKNQFFYNLFNDSQKILNSQLEEFLKLINMINSPYAIDEKDEENHIIKFFNKNFYDYNSIDEINSNIKSVESELTQELVEIRKIIKRPNADYITNNKEPFLIEIRNTQIKTLPKDWLKINGTKTVSRFRSPKVIKLNNDLNFYKELLFNKCNENFTKFIEKIDTNYSLILNKIVDKLSIIDCLFSLTASSLSLNSNYCKPLIRDFPIIDLKNSRNPIIESLNLSSSNSTSSSTNYISNDFKMTKTDGRVAIVTGPNMGGKSSFIRQIAIIVIMAQIGCFIPAEYGEIGVFDSIHIRMGAQDDILKGESTFQVELNECSSIIENCTNNSLVLLDEIGRGTSTVDGYSIAYSILDYLITEENKSPFVLFITHYPTLHVLETKYKPIVKNYHMGYIVQDTNDNDIDQENDGSTAADDTSLTLKNIIFLYTLENGVCNNSYGLNVAKLAGIPNSILTKGLSISNNLQLKMEVSKALRLKDGVKEVLSAESGKITELLEYISELD